MFLSTLAVALGILALFVLVFHQTLYGVFVQRFLTWEEDAFRGKRLSELETALSNRGQILVPVDSASFYAITRKRLQPNQRAMRFVKGKEYPWFYVGTAVNIGYVVVEKEAEIERIDEIIHALSVDSL